MVMPSFALFYVHSCVFLPGFLYIKLKCRSEYFNKFLANILIIKGFEKWCFGISVLHVVVFPQEKSGNEVLAFVLEDVLFLFLFTGHTQGIFTKERIWGTALSKENKIRKNYF